MPPRLFGKHLFCVLFVLGGLGLVSFGVLLGPPGSGCVWICLAVAACGLLGPAVAGCGRLQLAGLAASGCGWQWPAVAGSVGLWLHGLLLWL